MLSVASEALDAVIHILTTHNSEQSKVYKD